MREYHLSLAGITGRKEFHRAIAGCMDFPEYYGGNLDALMDVLTDIGEETCLTLTECGEAEANLGTYYRSLLKVLRAASRENPKFAYEVVE